MLNKSTIILELKRAVLTHQRWVKRAEHLISGLPVEASYISLEPTSCGFGQWFYGPVGYKLKSEYIFALTMERIERCHDELHKIYVDIYDIFYTQPESLLEKVISLGRKRRSKRVLNEAKAHFEQLQKLSEELVYLIEKLEKAVKAVDMVVLKRRHDTPAMFTQA